MRAGPKHVLVGGPPFMTCRSPFHLLSRACKLAIGLTFQTCLPTTLGSQNQLRLLVSVTDNACAVCTCLAKRLSEYAMGSALRIRSSQISVRIGPVQNVTSLSMEYSKTQWSSEVPLWSAFQEGGVDAEHHLEREL